MRLINIITFLCGAGNPDKNITTSEKFVSNAETQVGKILDVFRQLLDEFLLPFIIAIGVLGAAYGLYLGINYSRSEGDARTEAKKRIINFIIGIVAVLVLIILLIIYTQNADNFISWIEDILGRSTGTA